MKNMGEGIQQEMKRMNVTAKYEELIGDSINDSEVKQFLSDHKDEIDSENLQRSAARIYEFVQEKRKIAAGKESFARGYLPKLIINNRTVDVTYVPDQKTQQKVEQNQFKRNFELVDLPSYIRDAELTDYPTRNASGRAQAFTAASKFLTAYKSNNGFAPGLFLAGNFGVGKTYLLGAIANELARDGVDVKLVHFPSFAGTMKGAISDNSVLTRLDKFKKTSVLMLDDIGADSVSDWIRDEVLGVILQYRMEEQLPTFFSSNFSMQDLENHLSMSKKGEEPIKAQRIMERIKFLSREVIVSGENQRHQNQIEY
ncbi:primosomal protein DnaI [Companilactobacillus sp. RD055328]|uniref:primosomal protein DnaI n=1 Tax=Companilactobacillus sp. RD055328 TaxID=2916634 RepID=UPI001FC7DFDE|nr:primosomal protein DnaI [Companilactobacillus sp. RD055328]GKQ42505.1 primosomal protein DnaI [Companilactobacillus sp. RD055328]